MTNKKMLMAKIDESGLKINHICKMIDMDYRTFYNKVNNISEFKPSEIDSLCKILKITKLTDKQNIFFAQEVD